MITVKRLDSVKTEEILNLLDESKREGFRFLERLAADYQSGDNTFNKPGEMLLGAFHNETLIGIGGINQDPYSQNEKAGRIRRFYVSKEHRRQGVGELILRALLEEAEDFFDVAVLRTDTQEASLFYKQAGFIEKNRFENSTHYLDLKRKGDKQ
ncbi:GNAT family N-acetyltransferase [Peribacillus frigoritolerans]|uniref:GNAT family N-acetyltransferase n=1 Tax=Peribacillus frigoritolerans TaxID=450367 RepID=UPI00105A99DE|nr:GNAT family N-acetyltransferase [Peribacillus frigoritolerans]TDL77837.1 GNAT family N-acetyltransferase [Peribacillus frigoritolerans]